MNITTSGYVPRVPTLNNSNRVPTGTRSVSSESRSVKDEPTEEAFAAFRSLFQQNESEPENTSQYIPQLISIQNLNTAEREIKDRESLKLKLESVFKDTENIDKIVRKHLDKITAYKPEQQNIIYNLYDTILVRELDSHEKEELLEIIKSPVCFVGLKAPLELFRASRLC